MTWERGDSTGKRILDALEPLKLCRGKTMIERVTVVKFGVNQGRANDTSSLCAGEAA